MEKYSIVTGLRNDVSILKDVFFTSPFKVVEVREDKTQPLLQAMVMSSSPGMLNDDYYDINIKVVDGSFFNLQTQSYQRIHVSEKGTQQRMAISVGKNAYFSHVPHPVVPHKGSSYKALNTIELTGSSTLVWGEILTCGRKLMAQKEVFTLKKHHSITQVFVDGQLVFKDNLFVSPSEIDPDNMGVYEGYTHQGSLLFWSPEDGIALKMKQISERLNAEDEVEYGISKISDNAYLLRLLGHGGEKLFQLFSEIRAEEDKKMNQQHLIASHAS